MSDYNPHPNISQMDHIMMTRNYLQKDISTPRMKETNVVNAPSRGSILMNKNEDDIMNKPPLPIGPPLFGRLPVTPVYTPGNVLYFDNYISQTTSKDNMCLSETPQNNEFSQRFIHPYINSIENEKSRHDVNAFYSGPLCDRVQRPL